MAFGVAIAGATRDAIKWEELPSLAGSLAHRLVARSALARAAAGATVGFETGSAFAEPWNSTLTATLDAAPPSPPFREALSGLSMCEINVPDEFQQFFGTSPAAGDELESCR